MTDEGPTSLVREWLDRLETRKELDLHELVASGDPIMDDLLAVYTPRDFSLDPLAGSSLAATPGGIRLDLTALLIPPGQSSGSSEIGIIERHFDTASGWARHAKFELPRSWAAQGRGRLVTRESALMYEELGIREVTLNAVDYGRYVWAMCGFDFRSGDERQSILEAVADFAHELGLPIAGLDGIEHSWEVGSMEGEALTMRQIAEALGEEVEEGLKTADLLEERMLPGKALLLFSDYEGYEAALYLGDTADPAGRDQMLHYTDV